MTLLQPGIKEPSRISGHTLVGKLAKVGHFLVHLSRHFLYFIIPAGCASCGEEIAEGGGRLCARCYAGLRFVNAPFCDACAVPFASTEHSEADGLCLECRQTGPLWQKGRAAFVYEEQARQLVLGLKYGGRTEYADILAWFMVQAGKDILRDDVVLVPVPIHRSRLWRRGYNQAALLVNVLSRLTGRECYPNALRRKRSTHPLARLTRGGRRKQVHDVMVLNSRYREKLQGRHVVLVDDILTTGATAEACTKVLLENNCISVDILVAARVTLFESLERQKGKFDA